MVDCRAAADPAVRKIRRDREVAGGLPRTTRQASANRRAGPARRTPPAPRPGPAAAMSHDQDDPYGAVHLSPPVVMTSLAGETRERRPQFASGPGVTWLPRQVAAACRNPEKCILRHVGRRRHRIIPCRASRRARPRHAQQCRKRRPLPGCSILFIRRAREAVMGDQAFRDTVVITGASTGIGRTPALGPRPHRAHLTTARRADLPDESAERCLHRHEAALTVPADMQKSDAGVSSGKDRAVPCVLLSGVRRSSRTHATPDWTVAKDRVAESGLRGPGRYPHTVVSGMPWRRSSHRPRLRRER